MASVKVLIRRVFMATGFECSGDRTPSDELPGDLHTALDMAILGALGQATLVQIPSLRGDRCGWGSAPRGAGSIWSSTMPMQSRPDFDDLGVGGSGAHHIAELLAGQGAGDGRY